MKILLLGEYSNVHATLAKGLRMLGHKVTLASNGDFWKDYPRDIDLSRTYSKWGGIKFMAKLYANLPRMKGYDIVQLINPIFFEIKAERLFPIYQYLRRHNGKVVLGAFGMDYYWVNTCVTTKPLRYSDFNFGEELRTDEIALREREDWIGTAKERLNKLIADDCDGIVAGLYEYWVCYHPNFPTKTTFIPYPIELPPTEKEVKEQASCQPLHIFIGINKSRSVYKGTDIMLRAAERLKDNYPEQVDLRVAESIPFEQYQEMINTSDVLLDQLYSYTPAMNGLLAMSKGIICVGGGEQENYTLLDEEELRPLINVYPTEESVYIQLEQLVLHPERVPLLKAESIEYIRRHHEMLKVAQQYVSFYNQILDGKDLHGEGASVE